MIAGIIEGFYGPPWTHQERLRNIDLLAEHGGNTYVWAAKLEPRHRQLWRDPFTELELTEFAELSIRQKTVQVLIGLTPGADATTEQVINKLQRAIDHGCHGVVLSFDDLPALDAATKHQEIANALIKDLKTQVWLVPTHYAGITSSPYLEQLIEGLHPEVLVMWTGVHVVNDSIDAHEARQRTQACRGRKPLLWDNTPVNDAMMSEALHLGPYAGREPALRSEITGLLINPMEFATASQPTLVSALAWVNDGEPYSAWLNFVDQHGWTEFACCTAFPDDPHWPGARPTDDWWQAVVDMNPLGLEAGCEPWVDTAKQGAQLVLDARRLLDPAIPHSQSTVLRKITLAMRWRSWQRLPVLLYGGGPRLRPVIINDEHGEFVYRHGSVIATTCLVDDEVMRCLNTD